MTWNDLDELQVELAAWQGKNFPNPIKVSRINCFTGMVEELGELAHVDLKERQGIRGYNEPGKARAEREDCLGDLLIYLINYADTHRLKVSEVLQKTAAHVLKRDWQANPVDADKKAAGS